VPQAAGVIHSDFERGFIKAEVRTYKGSQKELLRLYLGSIKASSTAILSAASSRPRSSHLNLILLRLY
jgi:ribosome-binding ATPase YchF (GTP1/OBG family)